MSVFDVAFDKALARVGPGVRQPFSEARTPRAPIEDVLPAVDKFEFDPTRLVVAASIVGEQYRALKTNLSRFRDTEGIGTFTFSSSVMGEGKTTLVVNTARAYAREKGVKVAVVDCDFKRPGVSEFCRVEPKVGFEEVVAGSAPITDCGVFSRRDGFAVFPIKIGPEETVDLVASPGFDKALAALESMFDMVLFDTSPVLSTTEPLVLGAKTGGVILVVKANSTQRESVLYAQGQLEQAGCRLLGVVLNARPSYVPRLWLLRRFDYFQDDYAYKAK